MLRGLPILVTASLAATAASAEITISTAPTSDMTCSGGICVPTMRDAVLNTTDLENLLAAGNLEIEAYAPHADAKTISVKAAFGWSNSSVLTFYSDHTAVGQHISVNGAGGVSVQSRVGRAGLAFGPKGRISFANTSGSLTIGITVYTLESTLPALAGAIATNPQGAFALATSYDASADGTYSASPIPTNFNGALEGLGNTISNIAVNNTGACCVGGLFESISGAGIVSDLRLKNVGIVASEGAAGLAYENFGAIDNVSVTGSIQSGALDAGGLIADNYRTVSNSYATASVVAGATLNGSDVGGLIGVEFGETQNSFATGAVTAGNGSGNIGGLVGEIADNGDSDCYATGNVSGGTGVTLGGLAGKIDYGTQGGFIEYAYSTGTVTGGSGSIVGGLIGANDAPYGGVDYWDTTTSGTNIGVGLGNDSGVTGLTTAQLQSGLPEGFDPAIWAEDAKVNNGLPYLRKNSPPKK